MSTQFSPKLFIVIALYFMLPMIIMAQEDFDQIYVNESETFEVLYNDSWAIDSEEADSVTFYNEDEVVYATYYDPTIIAFTIDAAESIEDVANSVAESIDLKTTSKLTKIGEREAAEMPLESDWSDRILLVLPFANGSYGIADIEAYELGTPTIEAMLATYNSVGGNVGTAKLNLTKSKKYPQELQDYNQTWQEAIAELQDQGVIGTGGSLVFNENYAYFSGQGSWFTPLARNSPFTDVIMAGELLFTTGNPDETEECVLSSRINISNQGNTTIYLDVGITNSGNLIIFDANPRTEDPVVAFRPLNVSLDEKIHILYLAIDDTITVYVNGKLMVEDATIDERSGVYGISLIGQGPKASCEGRNIWVYQSPSFKKGVCEISATSDVNKRSGPGTTFDRAGQLKGGTITHATAQGSDGSFIWWKLEDESWVREDVVTATGDCKSLPSEKA